MEGKELHPTLVDGVNVFDVEEVTRVAQELSRRPVDPTKEGERDARAFEMLAAGHDIRDLVTRLRISISVAKPIVGTWIEAGQSDVVVPRACKLEIEKWLPRFRNAAELVERVRAADTENERVKQELLQLQSRMSGLAALLGNLAARTPALADALSEIRTGIDDDEFGEVLDYAYAQGQKDLLSAAQPAVIDSAVAPRDPQPAVTKRRDGELARRAPVPPARRWVTEVFDTGTSGSDVELSGAGASTDTTSAPDTSTTKASVNEESAGRSAVGESVAAAPSGFESLGWTWHKDAARTRPSPGAPQTPASTTRSLLAGRAVDDRAVASSPEAVASGTGATAGGAAIGTLVAQSPRELLLDAWLESLAVDEARLQRLGTLLTPRERVMLAELASTTGTGVAVTAGSRSPREQVLDALVVSLTEDKARLNKIRAMLTLDELEMLAALERGLAECETAAAMDGAASSE